jgi:hypothetical protein
MPWPRAHELALSAAPPAPDLAWAFCEQIMKLSELRNQQNVRYRLGREAGGQVSWGDWTVGAIFTHARGGEVLMLTPWESWAEYRVRHEYSPPDLAHPYGYFHAEGYYMEIEGLTGL